MKAVILAGGRERGFAPLSRQCPKALLPVANTPLLAHTLRYLGSQGIREVILCVNEDARSIRERFPDGRPWGLTLRYSTERIPLGTGGCVRELQHLLGDAPFLVIAGLPFLDFPLAGLITSHREREAIITVALTDPQPTRGFAEEVVLGDDGMVEQILVPYGQTGGAGRRTLGLYILEPRVFQFIGRESYLDLKEQLIPRIRRAGLPVFAGRVPGVGARLDTVADYLHFCHEFLSDGFMGWGKGDRPEELIRLGADVSVSTSASLCGPLLVGDRSAVSARARVEGPTAMEAACTIHPGSTVVASVLMEGAQVSEGARLERCVVAPGCHIPPGESLADHLVLRPDGTRQGPSVALRLREQPGLLVSRVVARPGGYLLRTGGRGGWLYGALKRTLDLCGASLGSLVAAPLLAVAALAIKLDSPGPVLFRQRRAGMAGREFTLTKLRTMVADAERLQEGLVDRNEVDGPMFKIGNDPRMTRVGRFLRRTRIDELPQLVNVLRGEMSLVGPRPLAMSEMRYNPAWRHIRLSVKPGATGLWQVESSRKNTFQDWIAADVEYVERQDLWLDLQILARTVREVWRTLWVREG
jgi:lipopolysaccharide/colanic/teichoic acid biosynthesis glycosyltransferase/NDP-sugar pyrophosphorylase family protein